MRWYRKIEAFFLACINFVWKTFIKLHEKNNIKSKNKLVEKVELTDRQKKQIDDFYLENYGKKIPYKWHRMYQSFTGNFDYRYIPDYIYTVLLEELNNKRIDVLPFENKAMIANFARGVKNPVRVPKTYVSCVGGSYFDGEGNPISKKDAVGKILKLCETCPQFIIKKTVDTSSGRGVRLINAENGIDTIENERIESVIEKFGGDFAVQEKIIQNAAFSALYSGSVNTLRVITYRTENKINVAPTIMRIGRNGYVDNAHAGGMFIGVSREGKLLKQAFTEYGEKFEKHPVTNVVFENYELPAFDKVMAAATEMHKNYPALRFISWDFTVDENENVVLIEANLHSQTVWMSQSSHGKGLFEENTAEILALVRNK